MLVTLPHYLVGKWPSQRKFPPTCLLFGYKLDICARICMAVHTLCLRYVCSFSLHKFCFKYMRLNLVLILSEYDITLFIWQLPLVCL